MLDGKKILLIISGGIAAYKTPQLIRDFKEQGADVTCILSEGGKQFVTPITLEAVSENTVHEIDSGKMEHISLTRDADIVVLAPASANMIAKIARGEGSDLASAAMLANNKPALVFPAMNPQMYSNPIVQENLTLLSQRELLRVIEPATGEMACGETGQGRMPEPLEIVAYVQKYFERSTLLKGMHAIVTSGPTRERIDPVRYISNDSSGKQGHAIAKALAEAGADVTLVTGPVALSDPAGVKTIHIESARDMLSACENALPANIAVCAAAVSDWYVEDQADDKIKKGKTPPFSDMNFKENPDILKTLSNHEKRPGIVVGFAAETENLIQNAQEKLKQKGCDMIVANNVKDDVIFGADTNKVCFVTPYNNIEFPKATKQEVAEKIVEAVIRVIQNGANTAPEIANDLIPNKPRKAS